MKKIYSLLAAVLILVLPSTKAQVVINEVYGGGGNSGATWRNDFIELYNNGSSAVSLVGWSIQYASSAGSTWQKTDLTGSIPAHGYYLIQQAMGAGGTTDLPTPDAIGTIAMSASTGKVTLVNNTTILTGSCPTGPSIIDRVGYGGANCFEGAGPTAALSNTTSAQRTTAGQDSNNNNSDFTVGSPSPTNSGSTPDTTPPSITSLNPADNSTGVPTNSVLSIVFDENITKNVGVITVHNSSTNSDDYVFLQTSNPNVSISGNTITITGVNLQPNSDYYIRIPDSVIQDLASNEFPGINDNTTWNFSTGTLAPPVAGQLNFTYDLNAAPDVFSNRGFKQYSVNGPLVWEATTFGNSGNGLQMNGFFGGSNQMNEDWLILPPFDLTATNFPLLSFYSRTRFNGDPLQLKISTDYPGFGDPNNSTWSDLNGKFPNETSDIWTQSTDINLSAFKQTNVYIAFVYQSSQDDGARWTLDDIRIDNSSVAPPPVLSISSSDLQFGYVANGSTAVKTFNLNAYDIINDVALSFSGSSGVFSLSKDGIAYSSSLNYTVAEANNISKTVFVRFSPIHTDRNYNDTIVLTSGSLDTSVTLKGSSIDPIKTLEVVNWNVEWLGSTSFGPTNESLQQQNVQTIMQNIGADLYALEEVVSETALQNIVNAMPGYAYVLSNFGSHTNPNENPPPAPDALAQAQKLAFVYKISVFSNVTTTALLSAGINTPADVSTTSYNNWASGRYPFMMSADVTLDGVTKNMKFIVIHAKANTAPTIPSYNRRKAGADELYALLNSTYSTDNIVLLGDFNDDLDQTITDGITPPTTSYVSFTSDPSNYRLVTLPLSQAGKKSTVSHDNVIDHVIVSSELGPNFMNASANILTDVTSIVSGYGTTTSDHFPVFTRYMFNLTLPIKLNYFTADKVKQSVKLRWSSSLESNSREYVVERSSNGIQYVSIGKLAARGQASVYEFVDDAPLAGNNYYRLRLVDLDEKFEHSKAIRITFEKEVLITIRPNPAPGFTKVALQGEINGLVNVSIYDQQGRIIKQLSRQAGPNQPLDIDLSGVNKGVYILKIRAGGILKTEKLVIQ